MSESLDDVKKRILGRLTLAGLIGETVTLETRSGRPMGLCPFHNEKSPSFALYDQHFYCFGCKKSGDAIDFVRETQGLSFIDALRYLAGKYGVEAPELEASRGRFGQRRDEASLYKMMADAQDFYAANLARPEGQKAMEYALGRGFTPESIKDFGFGLTPTEGYGLVRHLRGKHYREESMIDCSLATTSARDGRVFDFLRQRLTLPIRDHQGRIIGFGGRTLDGSQPKYLNSRESKLFDKGHTLYGFDRARTKMRERGRALVVEGYMDTLQLWQSGLPETVACLGTAFTEAHLKLLRHATSQVILLFDGDSAGQRATLAAVNVALAVPEVQIKAAVLPAGEDPDTYVQKHGVAGLEALLAQSCDLLDFAVRERLRTTSSLAVPTVVQDEFVPWLAQVPERIQRAYLINRIAQLTGIPAASIEQQLRAMPAGAAKPRLRASAAASTPSKEQERSPLPPLDRLAFDLFGHVYHAQPGELTPTDLALRAERELTLGPEYMALLGEFCTALGDGTAPASRPAATWTAALEPEIAALVEQLQKAAPAFVCTSRSEQVSQVLAHVEQQRVRQTVTRLKAELSRAAADPARRSEVQELLKTIHELNLKTQAPAGRQA